MTKRLRWLALLLIAVLALPMTAPTTVAEGAGHVLTKTENYDWFYRVTKPGYDDVTGNADRMIIDKKEAFCIEPNVMNANGDVYPAPTNPLRYFKDRALMRRLAFIIAKGYNESSKTWRDRLITKLAVWNELGWTVSLVEDYTNGKRDVTATFKTAIADLAAGARSWVRPVDFGIESLRLKVGESKRLRDRNGVLSDWVVTSAPRGVTASISGDELIVKTGPDAVNGTIRLEKKTIGTGETQVFAHTSRQDILVGGKTDPVPMSLDVTVYREKSLRIVKRDAATGAALAGAVFELSRDATFTSRVYTLTTDVDGVILSGGWTTDGGTKVYVREKEAPPGYIRDETVKTLSLDADEDPLVVEFANAAEQGAVRLRKHDAHTGAPVPGTVFELSRDRNFTTDVLRVTTGSNGAALSEGWRLVDGSSLYVREVSVPDPYVLDSTVKEVTLRAGETAEVIFENILKTARLKIIKRCEESGEPLAQVRFEISRDPTFAGEVITVTTGEDGTAILEDWQTADGATAYVREVSAPPGYVTDPEVREIVLRAGETTEIRWTNHASRGALCLVKRDEMTGGALAGVVFDIARDETFSSGVISGETDEAGEWLIPDLLLTEGERVYVREVRVPPGYVLDDTVRSARLRADETTVIEFRNRPQRVELEVAKIDAEGGNGLAGAVFALEAADDIVSRSVRDGTPIVLVPAGTQLATASTDADGLARFGATAEGTPLFPGNYLVREVSPPPGYVRDETAYPVAIDADETGTPVLAARIQVDNEKTQVTLAKSDLATGAPVPEAVLEITDEAGDVVRRVTTDASGQATIEGLVAGTYTFREILAPEGYVLNDASFTFVIGEDGRVDERTEFTNDPSCLRLLKTAASGDPLAGAAFELLTEEGVPIRFRTENGYCVASTDGEQTHLITDEKGVVEVRYLPLGTYQLREVSAPEGYVKDDRVIELTLTDEHGSEAPLTVRLENEKEPIHPMPVSGERPMPLPYMVVAGLLLVLSVALFVKRHRDERS